GSIQRGRKPEQGLQQRGIDLNFLRSPEDAAIRIAVTGAMNSYGESKRIEADETVVQRAAGLLLINRCTGPVQQRYQHDDAHRQINNIRLPQTTRYFMPEYACQCLTNGHGFLLGDLGLTAEPPGI